MHTLPGTIKAPEAKVVDGLPGRDVVRQESPRAAALDDVEDGVKDLTQAVGSGPPIVFESRQMSFEVWPFSVRKIGRVRLSYASLTLLG